MRKKISPVFLVIIFLLSTVALAHADVSVESTIEENIFVVCNITGLDQPTYDVAKANPIFNGSAIAQTIVENLGAQNLTNVTHGFQLNTYDDANRAIQASFFLGGTDIIVSNINRTSLRRDFEVHTGWRKFQVNLTSSISIDFTYFAETVETWQRIDFTDSSGNVHPSYYYEAGEVVRLGKMSFRFILPSGATNVQANNDTITYDVSLSFADVLIGSPFPILIIIIIVVLIVLAYRKIR